MCKQNSFRYRNVPSHLTKQLSLFFKTYLLLCLFLRLVSRFSPGWACLWGIKGVHHQDQQLSCLCNAGGCMRDLVCVRRHSTMKLHLGMVLEKFSWEFVSQKGMRAEPGVTMQFTWKFSHSCRFGFSAVLNSTSRGSQNTAFLRVPGTKGASVLLLAKRWEMTSRCLFCCSNPFFSAEKGKGMNCLELTGSQQLRRVTPLQQVEENERSHFRHSLASECSMHHSVCITCVFLQKN